MARLAWARRESCRSSCATIDSHFDETLGKTRLPVVSIQMPPSPIPRDLYEEILVGMGGVFSQAPAEHAAAPHPVLARQLEVRMLVIDEIHAILAGTFREQRIMLNAIRLMANDLRYRWSASELTKLIRR